MYLHHFEHRKVFWVISITQRGLLLRGLIDIFPCYGNLMVRTYQIDFRKNRAAVQVNIKILNMSEWIPIWDCDRIESPIQWTFFWWPYGDWNSSFAILNSSVRAEKMRPSAFICIRLTTLYFTGRVKARRSIIAGNSFRIPLSSPCNTANDGAGYSDFFLNTYDR